jgi:hypothetical protein
MDIWCVTLVWWMDTKFSEGYSASVFRIVSNIEFWYYPPRSPTIALGYFRKMYMFLNYSELCSIHMQF